MVWLIGNKGMLGTELSEAFERAGVPFLGTDREVSILDADALKSYAEGKAFRWIVNCAAYTAVDKAEDEAEICAALNRDGPGNVARTAELIGASLLHLSTDYVFDGGGTRPYAEEDPVAPTGVYGKTKAEGEAAALSACRRTVIVRTAWLYGEHGPNFVATMLRLMNERTAIGVVADQRGTPTWARDLAEAIVAIVTASEPRYGIYHYSGSGETTWHEFALEIERLCLAYGLLGHECEVKALTTAEYPTKAKRPAYSVLSKSKVARDFGIAPQNWRASLERFISENLAQRTKRSET